MKSPLTNETEVRGDLYGRAERIEPSRLRGDFAEALKRTLTQQETIQFLVAVRSDKIANVPVPAFALAATDKALIQLREPAADAAVRYGIRSLVIPYRTIVAIELGERLLRGAFKLGVMGTHRSARPLLSVFQERGDLLEVPYHALDESLFIDLFRLIRANANV